jgi:hypothetical protein
MGERDRGGGEREVITRLVTVPNNPHISPTKVWGIYGSPDGGKNVWVKLMGEYTPDGYVLAREDLRYTVDSNLVVPLPDYNKEVSQPGAPTAAYQVPEEAGLNGIQAKFGGEATVGEGRFSKCNSIEDIDYVVSFFSDGKMMRRSKSTGEEEPYDLKWYLNIVKSCMKSQVTIPERIIGGITNAEGFREAIFRAIKSDFESLNSFDRCNNFDEIINRIENVVAYNKIFLETDLSRFNIPMIVLVNSEGQSLMAPLTDPRTGILLSNDCAVVSWLKALKVWKLQGNTADAIKSMNEYKLITSGYGLRAAVDRVLG